MVALKELPDLLEEKAERVFRSRFPGCRPALGRTPSGRILTGLLGWDGFRELSEGESVDLLEDVIREHFTESERNEMAAILPIPMSALEAAMEPLD